MNAHDLQDMARSLVAPGKGLLAADETAPTLSQRLAARGIASTAETRRDYREMLFTTPGLSELISGVILQDETFRQKSSLGEPLALVVSRAGMVPGIKVDTGTHPLAACPGELVTEGLDGLRARLQEYAAGGARFAKWRAVIRVSHALPTATCVEVNAHALGRYAALCQEHGLVPIVEPEVLMEGTHRLTRTEEVTGSVLEQVLHALRAQRVVLEAMLLKPNMVVPGQDSQDRPPVAAVAAATLRVLLRHLPAAVPGVVFLSGGQDERQATVHLDAINRCAAVEAAAGEPAARPWPLTFSYGRALQDPAMAAWGGRADGVQAGQQALHHRARCNSAASLGRYDPATEQVGVAAAGAPSRPAPGLDD